MSLSDLSHNPDAMAWTNEFRTTFPNCPIDDGTMLAWFANAMMAMYDSKVNPLHSRIAALEAALQDLLSWFDKPSEPEWRFRAGPLGGDDAVAAARELVGDNTEDGR